MGTPVFVKDDIRLGVAHDVSYEVQLDGLSVGHVFRRRHRGVYRRGHVSWEHTCWSGEPTRGYLAGLCRPTRLEAARMVAKESLNLGYDQDPF
jgi:hypothetical protein